MECTRESAQQNSPREPRLRVGVGDLLTFGVITMRALATTKTTAPSHGWRRFFLLLGMFFIAFCLGGLTPTPRAWSDIRSQWLGAAAISVVCVGFLSATARAYWGRGSLTGLQAALLSIIFGSVLIFAARELFVSALFLREVRSRHASIGKESPNQTLDRMTRIALSRTFQVGCQLRAPRHLSALR